MAKSVRGNPRPRGVDAQGLAILVLAGVRVGLQRARSGPGLESARDAGEVARFASGRGGKQEVTGHWGVREFA